MNHTSLRERRSHVSSPKVVGAMSRLVVGRSSSVYAREEPIYGAILRTSLLMIDFESLINRGTRQRKVLSRAAMSQMLLVAAAATPDNFKSRDRQIIQLAPFLSWSQSCRTCVVSRFKNATHARAHRSTKPPYLILLRNWNHATRGRTFSNCAALSRCLRRAGTRSKVT